jgi:hypothetical protein
MPRNSSGVYTVPAGTPAVTRTTISSSAYNTFLGDLATAITASLNVNGTAPMLAALNMNSQPINNLSDPTNQQDAATKNYVDGNGSLEQTVAVTSTAQTLTAAQAAARWLTLTGTLSGNTTITFPAAPVNECYVVNNCTGPYTLTLASVGAGTSVVAQPGALTQVFHDATNITPFAPSYGSGVGFRNRLINGSFAIDQVKQGGSYAYNAYNIDRWYMTSAGAAVTAQRITGVAPDAYAFQINGAAGGTSVTVGQRIDYTDSIDLAGQYVAISVKLASSLVTTVNWNLSYANSQNNFGAILSTTVTSIASGSWTVSSATQIYTATVLVPSAAITGLQLNFSVAGLTSGTWTLAEAQLEPGSFATPFERRPIPIELYLCQRRLLCWRDPNTGSGVIGFGVATSTTGGYVVVPVPPQFVGYIGTALTGLSSYANFNFGPYACNSITVSNTPISGGFIQISCTVTSGLTTGSNYILRSAVNNSYIYIQNEL